LIGQKLGHYEILAQIGEGGMGEVYRARDPRLSREVAIKILTRDRRERAESSDAQARFEREARAVAALSHPNILAIHDFGEQDGVAYAVTELLEGQTLLDELEAGPIPLRRAIDLAGQMADGLAAAHEKGIIHRDIKPANVFLMADGRLKILDFGLARTGPAETINSMTATLQGGTAPGTVLGTARYMSPEQVRGADVDPRSDIFAFGTVLWEMLSGKVAFQRDSAVEIMNAVLKEDPTELPPGDDSIPASVERIIRRCMEKAPERRFQSARDLAFAMRNSLDSTSRGLPAIEAPAARTSRRRLVLTSVALLVVGVVGGFWLSGQVRTSGILEPVKIIPLTYSGSDSAPAASPDGRTLAFVSERDGRPRIWLRQMQGGIEVPLTEGPDRDPKFSPDGSSILFTRKEGPVSSLYRVPAVGGAPRKIMDNASGACWSPDGGRIAYLDARGTPENLSARVNIRDLQSGNSKVLYETRGRFLHGLDWSPDGRWLLVAGGAATNNTVASLVIMDAETGEVEWSKERRRQFSAPNWMQDSESFIIAESSSLLGDISSSLGCVFRVEPFRDTERPLFWVQSVWAGTVDFVRFDFLAPNQIVFDEILWRGSLTESSLVPGQTANDSHTLTSGNSRDRQPSYSPDGSLITFSSNRSGNLDIWVLDRISGEVRQLTDDAAEDWDPVFTPDGRHVLWSSSRSGHLEIWTARADGSGARQVSNDGEDAENPTSDGQWVIYGGGSVDRAGIWKVRPDGSDTELIVKGSYFLPELSPDSHYVSYVGNDIENLIVHLYVTEIATGERVFDTEVDFRGLQNIIQPGRSRWMPDGNTLVFIAPDADDQYSLYTQDFRPDEDTTASRRLLISVGGNEDIESFGISPDGTSITFARIDHFRSLKLAEGEFGAGH